jgi:hypothetical protein
VEEEEEEADVTDAANVSNAIAVSLQTLKPETFHPKWQAASDPAKKTYQDGEPKP